MFIVADRIAELHAAVGVKGIGPQPVDDTLTMRMTAKGLTRCRVMAPLSGGGDGIIGLAGLDPRR